MDCTKSGNSLRARLVSLCVLVVCGGYSKANERIVIEINQSDIQPINSTSVRVPSVYLFENKLIEADWHFEIQKYETSCSQLLEWSVKEKQTLPDITLRTCEFGDQQPATRVNYLTAKHFCADRNGRLPTEAEWVVAAAIAGSNLHSCFSDAVIGNWVDFSQRPERPLQWQHCAYADLDEEQIEELFDLPGDDQKRDVDMTWPDVNGTYGMHGNVWEWTDSVWENPNHDPAITYRVIKGGAFTNASAEELNDARLSNGADEASIEYENLGFRCLWEIK